jgi:AraC-like DNA-binding protein
VTIGYALSDGPAPLRPVKYQRWGAHELEEFTALLDEAARAIERSAPAPAPDIVAQVRAVIGPDAWGEPAAARALGMSTATLRRRLSDEGTSFRAVASDMRRATAQSLLATEHALDDIAERLGFSDSRSFRRACQGWFGMAPAEYRKQYR